MGSDQATDGPVQQPDGGADADAATSSTTVVERPDGTIVVAVRGDLDAVTAPAVRAALLDAIDRAVGSSATTVRVDMGAVDFLDSVGISVLVASYNHAGDIGVTFELASVPSSSHRVLEITRLTDVFTIVD